MRRPERGMVQMSFWRWTAAYVSVRICLHYLKALYRLQCYASPAPFFLEPCRKPLVREPGVTEGRLLKRPLCAGPARDKQLDVLNDSINLLLLNVPLAVNKTASIFLPSVDGSTLTSDIDPTAATPSLALTSSGGVSVYGDKCVTRLRGSAGQPNRARLAGFGRQRITLLSSRPSR
ncbi:hypothetical protein AOLI_G00314480 [Acnodon oligacanthus]